MSESYQPPFHMTEEITNLIVEIGQYVGSITTYETMHQNSGKPDQVDLFVFGDRAEYAVTGSGQ